MSELLMPSLGADMEAGTLISWEKSPGDTVKRGDVVAVIETQKGAIEIEVFEEGILEACLLELGTLAPVGTSLAFIRTEGDVVNSPSKAVVLGDYQAVEPDKSASSSDSNSRTKPIKHDQMTSPRIKITPAARKLACQSGIELESLPATGPLGAIVLSDVASTIKNTNTVEATTKTKKAHVAFLMREAIAASMSRSKKEIPHYYLTHSVDLTNTEAFITQTNENRTPENRLLAGAIFIKALARALGKFPEFNGYFTEGVFEPEDSVHVGMAINIRGGGLVAPAIHNVPDLDLDSLMKAMRDLVARVRSGRFRASELNDPTITLSSLGERGVESLYGVIYPPQVAIVGMGAPMERPWVSNGVVTARSIMSITLAADHRVSDGHRGALFLKTIEKKLLHPEEL